MGLETLALVGAGASLVQGGLGFFGSMQQAKAQEAQAAYRAQVARNNAVIRQRNAAEAERRAKIADENARRAGFAGQEAAQQQDIEARRQIGAQRAGRGASGLRGGREVSFLQERAAEDRQNIRRQGDTRASRFRAQAQNFRTRGVAEQNRANQLEADAAAQEAFGDFAANTTRIGGIGSLIGGIGSAASNIMGTSFLSGAQDPAVKRFGPNVSGFNFPSTSISQGLSF